MNTMLQSIVCALALVHLGQALPNYLPFSLASPYAATLPNLSADCLALFTDPKGKFTQCTTPIQQGAQKDLTDIGQKLANDQNKLKKFMTDLMCCASVDLLACADDAAKDQKCTDADRKALGEYEKANNKAQITINGKTDEVSCSSYDAKWCKENDNGKKDPGSGGGAFGLTNNWVMSAVLSFVYVVYYKLH